MLLLVILLMLGPNSITIMSKSRSKRLRDR
jgi:hypothetical protein